jgi:hypothetical protein
MEDKKPTIVDQATSLAKSTVNWATKDKFTTVSSEVFQQRKSTCDKCEHWDQSAYNKHGRCKICGCSVVKLYIPSAFCPHNPPKWEAVSF